MRKPLIFISLVTIFVIYGYLQAMPTPSSNQKKIQRPKIVIEPNEFDFGRVEFGKVVKQSFLIKNTGDVSLKIKRVSTSCACTKARVSKGKLEPGEITDLLVTYDAGAMGKSIIGKKLERFVYIRSNDPIKPQVEVVIRAEVK